MKCIAIDDEPGALTVISHYSSKIPFLTLEKTYSNALLAIEHLRNNSVDLIFLDINMPDISGLDFIKSLTHKPLIIFSTAYSEYAVESYDLQAVDYLLKPYEFSRFLKAVTRASDLLKNSGTSPLPERDFMFIKSGYQQQKVIFKELLFIEGTGNYVTFNTKSGKHLLRAPLKSVLDMLPKSMFVQVHKSFIVSLRNINKIEDNHVFIESQRIPIGNLYRDELNKMLY